MANVSLQSKKRILPILNNEQIPKQGEGSSLVTSYVLTLSSLLLLANNQWAIQVYIRFIPS